MISPASERHRSALHGRLSLQRSTRALPPSNGGGEGKRLFLGPTVPINSQYTAFSATSGIPSVCGGSDDWLQATMINVKSKPDNLVVALFQVYTVLDHEVAR